MSLDYNTVMYVNHTCTNVFLLSLLLHRSCQFGTSAHGTSLLLVANNRASFNLHTACHSLFPQAELCSKFLALTAGLKSSFLVLLQLNCSLLLPPPLLASMLLAPPSKTQWRPDELVALSHPFTFTMTSK